MTPTVHNNGTSGKVLLGQAIAAEQAIVAALDAMCDAAPNGRDYYVQGPDAFRQASIEHSARVARLQEVRRDYQAIAKAIAEWV